MKMSYRPCKHKVNCCNLFSSIDNLQREVTNASAPKVRAGPKVH
jgi:hypothetical protein